MKSPGPTGRRGAMLSVVAVLVAGCASPSRTTTSSTPAPPATITTPPDLPLTGPAALPVDGLDLRSGPVQMPLRLLLPSLDVTAAVLGVGITTSNVMDAPMGPAADPVWRQAFWYRGSSLPGATGTSLIAGHADDPRGRPGVFAHIDDLRAGDPVVVRDTRSGLDIRFAVTESTTYSLDETADPAVLSRIYGAGPVAGTPAQPSADGQAHLTLITCAGTYRNGTHDQRLVVYATRTG